MGKQKKSKPIDLARKPRGFPDKREGLIHAEKTMIDRITAVYRRWGFEGLDTGAFEFADALGKFFQIRIVQMPACFRYRTMMSNG